MRSLALDQPGDCVAVILSGMGSDGTLGARALKEHAGFVYVQSLESAKFDSMPRSVIEGGLADVVAPAAELAKSLARLLGRGLNLSDAVLVESEGDADAFEKVILLLRSETGNDFSEYKKSTLHRRIQRRMGLHQLAKLSDYARYLRGNTQELQLLFQELLIGVTSFFRDPAAWDQLESEVIPGLIESLPGGGELRAWIPGCSTGEEAYSLAIVFKDAIARLRPRERYTLQIFATDLDSRAIDVARVGHYPPNISADVTEARLLHNFVEDEHGYQVTKDVRDMVIFAPHNVTMDPPFTKLHFISCRNLLIYVEPKLQERLVSMFHYCLLPNGILSLGSAETVGTGNTLFEPIPGGGRIYRRREIANTAHITTAPAFATARRATVPAPAHSGSPAAVDSQHMDRLIETFLLGRFAPPAVVTTEAGDIVYVSGKTGDYLEPAVGKANLNIHAMAREGLGSVLNEAFGRALRADDPVVSPKVRVGGAKTGKLVDLVVQRLGRTGLPGLVLVTFLASDVRARTGRPGRSGNPKAGGNLDREELLLELERSREELRTTREEMQASQEELRSMNEELQSANEELQSTNEELTTSKEESQSMNEELRTVNHELHEKLEELSQASDDMTNLLNSTDLATLFLDEHLAIRKFTTEATKLIRLLPADIGRPVTDLTSSLVYPDLAADADEVLRTLIYRERVVVSRDGRWFTVRIMPYRTGDNRIHGLVVTFVDTTAARTLELAINEAIEVLGETPLAKAASGNSELTGINSNEHAREILAASLSTLRQKARDGHAAPPKGL